MNRFMESMADADEYIYEKWKALIELLLSSFVTNIMTIMAIIVTLISMIIYPIICLFVWPPKNKD